MNVEGSTVDGDGYLYSITTTASFVLETGLTTGSGWIKYSFSIKLTNTNKYAYLTEITFGVCWISDLQGSLLFSSGLEILFNFADSSGPNGTHSLTAKLWIWPLDTGNCCLNISCPIVFSWKDLIGNWVAFYKKLNNRTYITYLSLLKSV